jgi:oligopeptide transport system substrate-binding protein
MKNGKKFTWGFLPTLLVLMSMLLVACGGSTTTTTTVPSQKAPAAQQVLNMPFANGTSDLKTLDPALSTDFNSIAAIDLVFTGLVEFDNNLRVTPQLAASYQLASDGLTWTFHLKPNLKFSDGTPLTSADVAYSINRALLPATKSSVAPIYLALLKDSDKLVAGKIPTIIGDSIMTPDPSTVVLIANKKAAYFLDALVYSCSYVVEKSLIA